VGELEIRVDCYSGYRGEETPRRLHTRDRTVEIREVVDRWLAPDHRYFKVVGENDATYILRQDTTCGTWSLTVYESPQWGTTPFRPFPRGPVEA
jgi:hypothetical protein